MGELGAVTFFILEVPGYESAMLIYFMYIYRRRHEKTSYVSNYAFFTVLHKWGDRGQTQRLEELQ